jgi:hypothetical protein
MNTAPLSNVAADRILAWLLSRRDPVAPIDPVTGRYLLPYGRMFRRVSVLMLGVAAGSLVLGAVGTWGDTRAFTLITSLFGMFLCGCLWGLYESHVVTLGFSRDGIFRRGFGQEVWIPWSDVTRVDFSESMKWFRFRTRSRGTIRVSLYRNGLGTLADHLEVAPLQAPAHETGIVRARA